MSKRKLLTVNNTPVYLDEDGSVSFTGEFTVNADGCPRCYGPKGCDPEPYDWLANAGAGGRWWGVVTNPHGQPFPQKKGDIDRWPFPGLYVSTTAYAHRDYDKYDCRRYVDSEIINYAVVPGSVRMAVRPRFLGCRVIISDSKTGRELVCVCADIGPARHLGEASMAAAEFFGLNPDPKKGGSSERKRWHYRFFPGEEVPGFTLQ